MKKLNFKILLVIPVLIIIFLIYIFVLTKPSNDRNWESGIDKLPQITISGDQIVIKNLRDYHFEPGGITSTGYVDQTVNINDLNQVWFILEPFGQYQNITAHTYFAFDFKDQEPIMVSVEARREKGEKYNVFSGLFNQYELIYIWGTEMDETVRRVFLEKHKLYMYPLKISQQSGQKLFLQLAQTSHGLETNPRFYNSLTSNCTNELAKAANEVKSGAIPFNMALFLPGLADGELYKLGFIPNDQPLEQIRQKYYISEIVKENYTKKDFSQQLRLKLPN